MPEFIIYTMCFCAIWPFSVKTLVLGYEALGWARFVWLAIGVSSLIASGVVGYLLVQSLMT